MAPSEVQTAGVAAAAAAEGPATRLGPRSGPQAGTTPDVEEWLERLVRTHAGLSGLVYRPSGREVLSLVATFNVTEASRAAIRTLPRGEGVVGLAFERNAAISTCDTRVRRARRLTPTAKFIDSGARVAIPVHDGVGEVRAVVAIGFPDERTLEDEELLAIDDAAGSLPDC